MVNTINRYLDLIEEEIKSYSFGDQPAKLYEPIRYIIGLGGKRLRPLLTILAYSLHQNDFEKIIKAAVSVEVFHNFTLMHDDIMDNAPLRRGMKTVHEKWNPNVAILSGDVMMVKAYDLLLESETTRLSQIMRKFNKCAIEVCEGQQLDMLFEDSYNVSEEEYLNMIKLKTAVLLGYSLELGGMLANEDEDQCLRLNQIGTNIGIGFQLKDDLLDIYADQAKFGKQVGGDIIANKKTYLLIKAKELAKGKNLEQLNYWLEQKQFDSKEKVAAIKCIFDNLNIKEKTEVLMNDYFKRGLERIELLNGNNDRKALLHDFIVNLIDREK